MEPVIYILIFMAFAMFGTSIGILYFGRRHGIPNTIVWALFALFRGIHWLVEFISDYYEEVLDIEMPILERLELFTALCSSFVLLAACLEFNGAIRRPFGKISVLLASIIPFYYLIVFKEDTIESIEETHFFRDSLVNSDPQRFLYGFIIPIIAIIAILGTYYYYYYQAKRGQISSDKNVKKITLIIVVLILLFSVFEGFDYFEDMPYETIFIGFRAITLAVMVIVLSFVVIFSTTFGLQKFLVVDQSGMPLFAYDFTTKSKASDDISVLTSGYLSAIVAFSEEISTQKGGFLSIRSQRLYYAILKTETKLYALQSILYNNDLENHFFNATKKIDDLIANLSKISELETNQVKEILDENFSSFV